MRVRESIDIERPPDEVWGFVADPSNDQRWCRKVTRVEPDGAGRWLVTHKPVPLRPPVRLSVEHVALEPPSRLALREEDDTSVFDVEYLLEPTPTGTRFTQTSDFEWKKGPRLLHAIFARGVRRDVRGQLRALKSVLERG